MKNIIKQILREELFNEIGSKRSIDTDIVYRDSNLLILVPKSFESAKSFSRGTQYCTGGDCPRHSEDTKKTIFRKHMERNDVLFRIFFKDGTKIRLTWNCKMNDENFTWGLGDKKSYVFFTNNQIRTPFDFDSLSEFKDLNIGVWNENYETLYQYINKLPKESISKMLEYCSKK